MATRAEMDAALQKWVVPSIRETGFMGSRPNFRRNCGSHWDLLGFTFHRDGGALIFTLARCTADSIRGPVGHIPPNRATVVDRHPIYRREIGAASDVQGDIWYRFGHLHGLVALCRAINNRLADPTIWDGVPAEGPEAPYAQFASA